MSGRALLFGILVLLASETFAVTLDESIDVVCDTRNTTTGKCCVFPFIFKGEPVYECTDADFGGEWCGLTDNYDRDKSWGECAGKRPEPIFSQILAANGNGYKSRDGVDLFQGDIVLTDEIREDLNARGIVTPGNSTGRNCDGPGAVPSPGRGADRRDKRAIMRHTNLRWMNAQGRPEIPYQIERSNSHASGVILRAMRHWESKVPCLKFVRRSSHRRYLSFFSGGGCYSMVGRQPGSGAQRISIGRGCEHLGTVVHEIGHALGFWHEQSRPDRDRYVRIIWANIQRGMAYNFHKYGTDKVDSRGVGYDYKSVMHYGSTAFGGGRRTIIGVGGQTNLGQRYGLSEKDARQGNLLYCGGSPPVRTPAPPRPPTPPPPACVHQDRHRYCPFWASQGHCSASSRWNSFMKSRCQKSCLCKPGGSVCVDKNPAGTCSSWKASGYCQRYRPYMKIYCKKTCNEC